MTRCVALKRYGSCIEPIPRKWYEKMPQCGVPTVYIFAYRDRSCVSDTAAREIRAAKTIFHVSWWPTRPRPLAAACIGWNRCSRRRNFLCLGSDRSSIGQMVARFGLDRKRCRSVGRIPHPDCGRVGGSILPGDRPFMVFRACLGFARRQTGCFCDDHYRRSARITWAGSVFSRWSSLRTPRNCDSALIAPTGIMTPIGSSAKGSHH